MSTFTASPPNDPCTTTPPITNTVYQDPRYTSIAQCTQSDCCTNFIGYCGVYGCTKCSVGMKHYCAHCGHPTSTHRTKHCNVRYAGIYLIVQANNTHYVLVQLRADSLGGYVLGCGGGVNRGELVKIGAIRELHEEAGVDLLQYPNEDVTMFYSSDRLACYYTILNDFPAVRGPDARHHWEVNTKFNPFDCPDAITLPGTGHAWLPLPQILPWLSTHPNIEHDKFKTMINLLMKIFGNVIG